MKICPNPNCGNKNPDTNKFCNYCGAQLSGVEPVGGPAKEPDFSRFFAPEQAPADNTAGQNKSAQYEDFNRGPGGQNVNRPGGQNAYRPGEQGANQSGGQGAYQQGGQGASQPGSQPASYQNIQRTYRQGAGNVSSTNGRRTVRKTPPQYTYSATPFDSKIPEIAIGKYIAWSVFDILFSLLFGILGLVFVLKINKSDTVEEQQKNLKYARIFLIIGTVIAILNIVLMILPRYF